MEFVVRAAKHTDGPAAINLLRRSISELCVKDHCGDAHEISDWLANKTISSWNRWFDRKDVSLLVVQKTTEVIAVGMIDHRGEILLNYVHPAHRFMGASKSILKSLENEAIKAGLERCFLESTKTAKQFYERCGYISIAPSSLGYEKVL